MTLDQIDRMVRQANPVPDLKLLEPVETPVLTKQRRMDMQTHDQVEIEKRPERPKQGLLIGIAAAAAVVIGALLLLPLGDEAPVADQPAATPVEVATAFLEAYAANDVDDVDLAASFLAPEALADFFGDLETMRLDVRLSEVTGFTLARRVRGNEFHAHTDRGALLLRLPRHPLRRDGIGSVHRQLLRLHCPRWRDRLDIGHDPIHG